MKWGYLDLIRCKYFRRIPWSHYSESLGLNVVSSIQCSCGRLRYNYSKDNKTGCEIEPVYPCYEPVELDPYWKDIFDETNRRLQCLK